MTHTKFITLEVPVNYENGPDGWYAWLRMDSFGGDAKTPEGAIKLLVKECKRRNDVLKPIVARREAEEKKQADHDAR